MEGCSTLPDMRLAKQAKTIGDYPTAAEHFEALASEGYLDAAIYLGDTYLEQSGSNAEQLAETQYREAASSANTPKSRQYAKIRLAKLLAKKQNPTVAELQEANSLLGAAYQQGNDTVLPLMVKLHMAHPDLWPKEETLEIIDDAQERGLPDANLALLYMYKQQPNAEVHTSEMAQLCEQVLSEVVGCYLELTEIYLRSSDNESLTSLFDKAQAQYPVKELEPSIL